MYCRSEGKQIMNNRDKAYAVKCPICGKDICDCHGESNISIKCMGCRTQFTIVRSKNSLLVEEKAECPYKECKA